MAAIKKLTGKASTISLNGVPLSITKYTPKVSRKMVSTQGSDNYDADTDMLQPEQLPVGVAMELSVEGNYDLNTTPTWVAELLFTGHEAVPVILGLDAGNLFGHGNFDISEFEVGGVLDDKVTFTCTLMQNGKFTPGS